MTGEGRGRGLVGEGVETVVQKGWVLLRKMSWEDFLDRREVSFGITGGGNPSGETILRKIKIKERRDWRTT